MTANEMSTKFLEKLDIFTSNSTPGLTDAEISSVLTDAEFQFVRGALPPRDAIDTYSLIKAELGPLYETKSLVASSETGDEEEGGKFWQVPEDFFYPLKSTAKMDSEIECLNGKRIPVKPITYDEYNVNIHNPFKKPGKSLVWLMQGKADSNDDARFQTIISNHYTGINNIALSYIKKPQGIVVYSNDGTTPSLTNSILPSVTHLEIVDIAVELAKLQLGLMSAAQTAPSTEEAN